MPMQRFALAALLALAIPAFGAAVAGAQNLPQTPTASEKAGQGGYTAGASLEREGGSALEPYLVTLLIPVFGLIIFVTSVAVDKRLRTTVR